MQICILGLGNELLGDEGVGVHAARQLRTESLSQTVRVIEVGTMILDALPLFEDANRLIILDAMMNGQASGTIYRVPLQDCRGSACIASMHGFDIFRTLSLVGRDHQPEAVVFGVEPHSIDWSMELSTAVASSMVPLIRAVKDEVERFMAKCPKCR